MVSPTGRPQFSHASQKSTRGTLRVAETFQSRQGEGKLTGTDSFFIRTSGCNLRCWFCDTPYASWEPSGSHFSVESLVAQAIQSGCGHVVLTGGEPLLPPDSTELCHRLREAGFHVTIETAGTIDRMVECDLLSLSPKFESSTPDADEHPRWNRLHQQRRLPIEIMKRLMERAVDSQVKFVVDSPADYEELLEIVAALEVTASKVWIMPQGSTVEAMDEAHRWLYPWCKEQEFRYCDRMQIRWFGNRRGT